MGRRRGGGHWCWSCQRTLANERFSGRGHARHLCKTCWRLPPEELAFRQVTLDIDRILSRAGKKMMARLKRFREHPDERVRGFLAEALQALEAERVPPEEDDVDIPFDRHLEGPTEPWVVWDDIPFWPDGEWADALMPWR